MKNKFLKIFILIIAIVNFVFVCIITRKDDIEFDPDKELAHLLVNKPKNNSNYSSDENTTVENSTTEYVEKPKQKKVFHSKEAIEYFNEIALNSEYTGKKSKPTKWTTNMKIYVDGSKTKSLCSELNKIVSELNSIIDPIDIEIVSNKDEANFFIFLGGYQDFQENYKVVYPSLLESNWGYFELYPNNYGIMCVDIYRATNEMAQKHLLREELTQSLGLINDSYKYPESIFYQGWSTTTEYAPIDREVIDILYN
ncbi:MAG: DUF2927 domain-containing protein [Verrucomicrobia bacterium]|nr:DUF2927 domain-containing protein [Verrucomicrobiota bacterium]